MSTKAFEVLSIEEMNKLESPGWLIHEAIPAQSLIQIFGREGHGKTFVALDLALRIAAGMPWAGARQAHHGKVVYVVGEGITGLKKRVAAWQKHNGVGAERLRNFWVVPEPVQLAEVDHITGIIRSIEAVTGSKSCDLIVFDTQARCTAGVDENSAEEMGVVVGALDWLRLETGAAIMLIHHSPYNVERGRGSSVVPGALDTVIGVTKHAHIVTLTCHKQKDWEEFEEFKMGILTTGESAVIVEVGGSETISAELSLESLNETEASLMRLIRDNETETVGMLRTLWPKSKATFYRGVDKLKRLNLLEDSEDGNLRLTEAARLTETGA